MKILVDSSYINNSGGKVLLESFIEKVLLLKIETDFYFIFDARFLSDLISRLPYENHTIVYSSFFNRTRTILELVNKYDFKSILCLNNLPPPLFSSKINVFIYFHNIFYFDSNYLNRRQVFLFKIKRYYISFFNKERFVWIVQNNTTKNLLRGYFSKNVIHVLPFYNENNLFLSSELVFDFIYVANNSPQKNLSLLLDVWEDLGDNNYFPSLVITIGENEDSNLLSRIQFLINKGIRIKNIGSVSRYEISNYYSKTRALIFPSMCESFGLPLVEAALVNMPILASNLSFVHDIIETEYLFDPSSKNSVFECVKSSFLSLEKLVSAKLRVENKVIDLIKLLYV